MAMVSLPARGRPPQAAARRADLEVAEKVLTASALVRRGSADVSGPPECPGDTTHWLHAMAPGLVGQSVERARDIHPMQSLGQRQPKARPDQLWISSRHPRDPPVLPYTNTCSHRRVQWPVAARGTVASGPVVRWRVAKWSRFPSIRLPEVLKAVNLCHRRGRSGTLVEDASLSGRQMQQCPTPPPGVRPRRPRPWRCLHAQGVAIVSASLLRSALGYDRVLSDAEVELVATAAWTRFHPAA